jgi:hypothetical protein
MAQRIKLITKQKKSEDPALVELASKINESHEAALKSMRAGMQHAIDTGTLLRQAKALVQHGQWVDWVKKNCPSFCPRTAQLYMSLAKYIEIMPHLKDTILDQCLNVALPYLRERYYSYLGGKQLDKERLGQAFYNHMEKASELAKEIKINMGDEGWKHWLEGLNEPQQTFLSVLTSPSKIEFPPEFNRTWNSSGPYKPDADDEAELEEISREEQAIEKLAKIEKKKRKKELDNVA